LDRAELLRVRLLDRDDDISAADQKPPFLLLLLLHPLPRYRISSRGRIAAAARRGAGANGLRDRRESWARQRG